ncbi:MAG: dockerin type I repeat-containing protein [Gemmatimonadota bacterium]|nr:MAG: dockerin type I repeat-containing protein [Gemmatimonadota bacterium]
MKRKSLLYILIPNFLLLWATNISSQTTTISWYTFGCGVGVSTSSGSKCKSSVGQTLVGSAQSETMLIESGFLADTLQRVVVIPYLGGDVTDDGNINVLDVLAVVNDILGIVILDEYGKWRADCNGDGTSNILDALGIVNVILGISECEP